MLAFLLSAGGAVSVFAAAAIWIWCRPQSRAARRCAVVAAVLYFIASIYAVPAVASRLLTTGFHPFAIDDAPRGPTALVVLGSGSNTVEGWTESLVLMSPSEASRVLEAWRLFRMIAPAIVVTSGGLKDPDDRDEPSGTHMRTELLRLGVPDDRIVVNASSLDTHEEAVAIAPLLRARHIEHLVLVTSDTHMRRAVGAFRAQGWHPVPAIAPEPTGPERNADWLVPSTRGLAFTQQVVHEIVGLSYYWLRGWWRS